MLACMRLISGNAGGAVGGGDARMPIFCSGRTKNDKGTQTPGKQSKALARIAPLL
jgi:hypothetical protein